MQVAVWAGFWVQGPQVALREGSGKKFRIFGVRTIAPVNIFGTGEFGALVYPVVEIAASDARIAMAFYRDAQTLPRFAI